MSDKSKTRLIVEVTPADIERDEALRDAFVNAGGICAINGKPVFDNAPVAVYADIGIGQPVFMNIEGANTLVVELQGIISN